MYQRRNLRIRLRAIKAENESLEGNNRVPLYILHKIISQTPYTIEDLDPKFLAESPNNDPQEQNQNIFRKLGLFVWKDPPPLPVYSDPPEKGLHRRLPRPPPLPEESEEREERRRETTWEFCFRRLSMQVTPIDEITRTNPIYRENWLANSSKPDHVFRYPREQVRKRNKRINFILQQRTIARRRHHQDVARKAGLKRSMTSVFRLAYLKFKLQRTEALESHGLLEDMKRLGWSAKKEWLHWRQVYKEGHKLTPPWRRGRLKRLSIPLDKIQVDAERDMFVAGATPKEELAVEKTRFTKAGRWHHILKIGTSR